MTLLQLLAVFIGGGAGSTVRHLIGRFIGERYGGDFPLGTYLINVSGCFALGLLATMLTTGMAHAALLLALLGTGFMGGYTTFSTYALEGVLLYLDGSHRVAILSLVGSVAAGLLAAAAGAGVAQLIV
ncbi:MAG: fluoride efflux transporter CrcB [Chloroflexi bacterium]|nr:fluoride efflux transporter CrcB [Chloroflexota bacterium]